MGARLHQPIMVRGTKSPWSWRHFFLFQRLLS